MAKIISDVSKRVLVVRGKEYARSMFSLWSTNTGGVMRTQTTS